jgi:anaerobic ribonucleoside-triphosphate reductase activating protein
MVVWVQGCTLSCPGCFNPHTHPQKLGQSISVDLLAGRILQHAPKLEGITISGGEPFQQTKPLTQILQIVRAKSSLSVIVFSGYTWEELQNRPGAAQLIACCDVLIAGRYQQTHRLAIGLSGSSNKTMHFFTTRYSPLDLHTVPQAEVLIETDGTVTLSGIEPVIW